MERGKKRSKAAAEETVRPDNTTTTQTSSKKKAKKNGDDLGDMIVAVAKSSSAKPKRALTDWERSFNSLAKPKANFCNDCGCLLPLTTESQINCKYAISPSQIFGRRRQIFKNRTKILADSDAV
jgi:hypothetical protein